MPVNRAGVYHCNKRMLFLPCHEFCKVIIVHINNLKRGYYISTIVNLGLLLSERSVVLSSFKRESKSRPALVVEELFVAGCEICTSFLCGIHHHSPASLPQKGRKICHCIARRIYEERFIAQRVFQPRVFGVAWFREVDSHFLNGVQ